MVPALQLVFLVVIMAAALRRDRRLRGEAGRERLLEMDAFDAEMVRSDYETSWAPRWHALMGVLLAVATVGAALGRSWPGLVVGPVGVVVAVMAYRSRREVTPHVLAVLDERDDPVLPAGVRESSERRARRVRQFLVVAVPALLLGLALAFAGAGRGSGAMTSVGLVLTVVGLLALAGAGWARAWRYGDEQPVPPS